MRWWLVLLIVAVGCGDPEPGVQPIANLGPPPLVEPPSDEIINPSANLRERTAEERARERERLGLVARDPDGRPRAPGGGGGGGGGPDHADWEEPSRAGTPSQYDVERFRQDLEREMSARVDPQDDPCEQFRNTLAAGGAAVERPGDSSPDAPSTTEMRAACRQMPDAYVQCMDREYFREHIDECQAEIDRMARRGRRRSEQARTRLDQIDRGLIPSPTEPEADQDDDEDG